MRFYKAMGLVSQVFNEDILRQLTGYIACGHTRYSTTGGSRSENAQPIFADDRDLGRIFIAHNGNLVNSETLREGLQAQGVPVPLDHRQRGDGRPDRRLSGAHLGGEDRGRPAPLPRLLLPGADDPERHLRRPRSHGQPPAEPRLPGGRLVPRLGELRAGHRRRPHRAEIAPGELVTIDAGSVPAPAGSPPASAARRSASSSSSTSPARTA